MFGNIRQSNYIHVCDVMHVLNISSQPVKAQVIALMHVGEYIFSAYSSINVEVNLKSNLKSVIS